MSRRTAPAVSARRLRRTPSAPRYAVLNAEIKGREWTTTKRRNEALYSFYGGDWRRRGSYKRNNKGFSVLMDGGGGHQQEDHAGDGSRFRHACGTGARRGEQGEMRHLVCQACGAALPARGALTARGVLCPGCRRKTPGSRPMDVTGDELRKHLHPRCGPVLLKVGASWSGPCRAMDPHFAVAARRLAPKVKLLRLDAQIDPAVVTELGVMAIPELILFRRGRAIARRAGAMSAELIVDWTKQALAGAPSESEA